VSSRAVRCTQLALALLSSTSAAEAQPAAAPPQNTGSTFESALQEADRRFVAGDLQGALAVLQPVCVATDSAECAFSLGAIHHGLGHCPEALAHYRRYLQLAPQGEHLGEVNEALVEVEGRCGYPERAPSAPSAAPPPSAAASGAPALAAATAEPSSLGRSLTAAAFAASGAAALGSVTFGVLAARSARRCERADAYDQRFVEECERQGPRYQGLWQGLAVASGAFLGIGVALWWSESRVVSAGLSDTGLPELVLHGRF
jgi:hypothetical protein